MGRLASISGAAAFGLALAGCASPPEPHSFVVLAAYSILAASPDGGTVALARVIVDAGRRCPQLETDSGAIPTAARTNPDPMRFPVTVCEAVQPGGDEVRVSGAEVVLPRRPDRPARIAVLGDTGCGIWQDCADPEAWLFARLAEAAAAVGPDLVIHVGDYVYRGTPGSIEVGGVKRGTYDAGDYAPDDEYCQLRDPYVSQNGPGSSLPDGWPAWREDFFVPAAPLLSRAPWVVARGNHELCSRAGPGWFYFLDPHSDLLGGELRCPAQVQGGDPLPNLRFAEPYQLDLGDRRLLIMDTANACDQNANFPDLYAAQFAALVQLRDGEPAWLITHRPIWGVDWLNQGTYQTSNVTLQQALAQGSALPPSVELVLSGHIQRFEAQTFPGMQRPPQLVVGNSGISLATDELAGTFRTGLHGGEVEGLAVNAFGYVDARPEPWGGWTGSLIGTTGETLAKCASDMWNGGVCARP